MKSLSASALLLLVLISSARVAYADEKSKPPQTQTGDSWFDSDSSPKGASTVSAVEQPQESSEQWTNRRAPTHPSPRQADALPPGHPSVARPDSHVRLALSEVRFEPDDPSLRLLTLSGQMPYENVTAVRHVWGYSHSYIHDFGVAPVYAPLCVGPCTVRLRPGHYEWAIAKSDGDIVPFKDAQVITGPSRIRAHYVDRSSTRTTGAVVGVVGGLTGIVLMIASVHDSQQCDALGCQAHLEVDGGLMAGGLASFAGSLFVSAILLNQRDEARISISPLNLSAVDVRRDAQRSARGSVTPQGARMTLRF